MSVQSEEIEACHRFGKTDRKTKSKKTIIHFVNRKYCKKVLLNKKKLSNINNNKFNFNVETNLYINENLTPMNKSTAFNCRKLKRSNIIHTCYTREGIVHIKEEESKKPFKIFHISKLYELFPDFVFVDDKGDVTIVIDWSQNLLYISKGNSKHFLPLVNGGNKFNLEFSFEIQSHMSLFYRVIIRKIL